MAKFISFPIFSSFIVIHLPKCYFSLCMEDSLVYLGNCRPGHGPAPACRVPRTADWLPAAGLEPPEPRPAAARQHEAIKCGDCGGHYSVLAFAVTIITLQFTGSLSPRPGPRYRHPRSSCSENDACCAKLDLTRARMTHYLASSI